MPRSITCKCGEDVPVNDGGRATCRACGAVVEAPTGVQEGEPKLPRRGDDRSEPADRPKSIKKSGGGAWPVAIVVVVIGVLALVLLLSCLGAAFFRIARGPARDDVAGTQVRMLTMACSAYEMKNGQRPQNLEQLLAREDGGPFVEGRDELFDPWGQFYKYDAGGARNNGVQPDIWAQAPDGRIIGNWPGGR